MPRRILFATVGQTPQVVTETIWALLHRTPPWVPEEVHIVTTMIALQRTRQALQGANGPLRDLLGGRRLSVTVYVPGRRGGADVYGPAPPNTGLGDRCAREVIESLDDNDSLSDVATAEDSALMGDLILRLMAGFVQDKDAEVHLSLAGGRKTTSAYALLAFSLVGRPCDEASHVLVSPAVFEDNPGFWYPGQDAPLSRDVRRDQASTAIEELDPKDATVTLVPTPAPLLRYEVRNIKLIEKLRLVDVVGQVNLAATLKNSPKLLLLTACNSLVVGDQTRRLGPKMFAMYRLIATAWKEEWPGVGPQGDGDGHFGWLSVPQICVGSRPAGQSIEATLLAYIKEAVAADGGDTEDHASVIEWRDRVLAQSEPRAKLAHAQTAVGANTRLTETLEERFGPPVAAIISPLSVYRRQARPIRDGKIWTSDATRFGLRHEIPPSGIEIF